MLPTLEIPLTSKRTPKKVLINKFRRNWIYCRLSWKES